LVVVALRMGLICRHVIVICTDLETANVNTHHQKRGKDSIA